MRIKLKKLKQKELINNFKKENSLTWAELSDVLGVKKGALLNWYYERTLLPRSVYKKIDPRGIYRKFIIQEYSEKWGKSKGGHNSKGNTKYVKAPQYSEKLAELVGIILGDGNLNLYNKNGFGTYSIRITGDANKDAEYLRVYIPHLFRDIFNVEAKIYKPKNNNGLVVLVHSRMVLEHMEKMGLKNGNKLKNQITIPKWIWSSDSYLRACTRGLIDTDGSIYELKTHWPGTYQINFENSNMTLLKDFRKALIHIGFIVSKICSNRSKIRGKKIYITRKDQIEKYYKEIGSSNPRKREILKRSQPRGVVVKFLSEKKDQA